MTLVLMRSCGKSDVLVFQMLGKTSTVPLSMRKCSVPEVIPLDEVPWGLSRELNY